MRLVTYEPCPGCERLGLLMSNRVIDLALASDAYRSITQVDTPALPADMMSFLNLGYSVQSAARKVRDWANSRLENDERMAISGAVISHRIDEVRLRAPVPRPLKILCLYANYGSPTTDESARPEKPYIFLKPGIRPVVGTDDKVFRPARSENLLCEGELAVVIGQSCRDVPKEKAYEVIAGYTVINDMTSLDSYKTNASAGIDWFSVKAFDTSLPMGPCLTLKDEIEDPHRLRLVTRVNGQVVQDSSTGEMVFTIPEIIEYISGFITLDPGDIICTGTPAGARGGLVAGDQLEVEITNIGVLRSIVDEREPARH